MKKIIIAFLVCALTFTNSFGQDLKTEKIVELNYILDPAVLAGTKLFTLTKVERQQVKLMVRYYLLEETLEHF